MCSLPIMSNLLSKACARLRSPPTLQHEQNSSDPYLWVKDAGCHHPDLQAYLKAESSYADGMLTEELSSTCQSLRDQAAARVPVNEVSAAWYGPGPDEQGCMYQRRRGPGDSSWRLVRWPLSTAQPSHPDTQPEPPPAKKPGQSAGIPAPWASTPDDNDVEIVLDENLYAAQYSYSDVGTTQVSPDGRFVAFSLDTHGNELFCIRVKQLGLQQADSEGVVIAEGCGPQLAWTTDSQHVVITHLTSDTRVISKVVRYCIDGSGHHVTIIDVDSEPTQGDHSSQSSTCNEPGSVTITWMNRVAREQYLAIQVSNCGGCEVRLVPLDLHVDPQAACLTEQQAGRASAEADGVAEPVGKNYVVVLPWQDEWDVHQVELVGDVLLALVDTDEHPDGTIMAVHVPQLSPPVDYGPQPDGNSQQQPTVAPLASEALSAQLQHTVVVQGSAQFELQQLEVVRRQLVVARTQGMITYMDVYHLPMCGKPGKGAPGPVFIKPAWTHLQPAWSWSPCTTYASVSLTIVLDPPLDAASQPSPVVRVAYSQLTVPDTTVHLDLDTQTATVIHVEAVAGFPPVTSTQYKSDLLYAPSSGGAQVPISIAYRQDLLRGDGTNPCIVHAYGAYGSKQSPSFNPLDVPLLDHGTVLAIAHVRGGGEKGAVWHKQGKLHLKHHTFDDVAAAVCHLCDVRLTSHNRVALWGRSAGGLAVAAAIARNPQLCRAAVLDVPFVDVLTSMSDPGLPLTRKERTEWGDPLISEEERNTIASYSPYHNLEKALSAQASRQQHCEQLNTGGQEGGWLWPHMLVTAGLHDERVPCWGPIKYVARLRSLLAAHSSTMPTSQLPVVWFLVDAASGHFGTSSAQGKLTDKATKCAFVLAAIDAV